MSTESIEYTTETSPGHGMLKSVLLNALVPFGLYWLVKHYVTDSELIALSVAALFPLFDSLSEFARRHSFDLIALFTLLGIVVSLIGLAIGGDTRILLIRESLFTGMLGVACLVSLLLPRPLMVYVGRQFMSGGDPAKIAAFNAQWAYPYARFVHRLITTVWASAFIGEFLLRVVLVYTLPTEVVLVVSPILLGGITVGTMVWTMAYVRRARQRGEERRRQAEQAP